MRKSIGKKICVAVALTMMLGAVSGCGVQEKTQNSSVDITGEEKEESIVTVSSEEAGITQNTESKEEKTTVEPIVYDDTESNENESSETVAAMKELWEKAVKYVEADDEEGFYASLFVNGQKGEWTDDFNNIKSFLDADFTRDNNPRVAFHEIFENGDYHYMVAEGYSDHSYYYKEIPISCKEGKWLFDRTGESYEKKDEKMYNSVPDGYTAANDAGRNVYINDWTLVWMNDSIYVPGQFRTIISLMWQNEDGSIDILVNEQNGTDENRCVTEWSINAISRGSGDIFDIDHYADATIVPPKSAKNTIIHVPFVEVKTGREKWEISYLSQINLYK